MVKQHFVQLARKVLGANPRERLRLEKLRVKRRFYSDPISILQFRTELERLGDWRGRTVWIQSSWNEMYNIQSKPSEIIDVFRDMVGPKGNLVMPAFPLSPKPGKVLKIDDAPSGTGLLTEIFRRQPDAVRSIHLRSSVVAVGPDGAEICANHHRTPYSWGSTSPFDELYRRDALMLSIGFVPMGFTPLHWVECKLHEEGRPLPSVLGDLIHYDWQRRSGESGKHAFFDRHGSLAPSRLIRYFDNDIYRRSKLSGLSLQMLPARYGLDRAFDLATRNITIYRHIRP